MPQLKSLSTRIVSMAMFSFVLIIALNYLLVSRSYNTDAVAAMEEKAGAFTAVADAAKSNQSDLLTRGGVDTSALLAEAQEQLKQGGRYQDTRFFNTIPVVVGWNAAAKAAEREGIEFQVVAFDARNKENSPKPGGFREQLLRDLEMQISSGGDLAMSRINPETNKLHYMRGIELDTSCMICHGEPGGRFDEDKDGLDPLGFPMEGWDPTQTHGAYEVVSSMDIVDERVSSFIWSGITWSVPLLGLVGFFFFAFLRSSFGKPMKVLVDRLRDIAEGDGDLSVRLNEASENEIGLVGKWFNQFLGKLEGIVGEMLVGMKQIDSGAEQVSKTSQDLAKGSTNQARELQQIEAMIDETSESTQRSAQNAGVASDHSSETSKLAKTGQEGVHEMNTAMEGIRQSSQEMAGVIKAIDDIAFQTNLLALNAAVEAARAGDAGQGFAVVAEEVRSLAQHSAEAARKTATMIADSMSKVEETSAISARVAEALDKIVDGTGEVDQLLTSIAEASNQQAGSIEQLTSTIKAIADVTQAGAGNSEELAAASEETASMVASLQGTIGVFRVREEILQKSQLHEGF